MSKKILKKKSKITLESISKGLDGLSKKQDSFAKTQDSFAKTQDSFAKTQDSFAKNLVSLSQNIDDLAIIVKEGFESSDKRLVNLERGQEKIELKLDNVAYRFELVELQRRVALLEKRMHSK